MSFRKIRSIQVSEEVLNRVCYELDIYQGEYGVKVDGWLETFYNCREQGFCLYTDSIDFDNPEKTKDHLYIWVFQHRNGDSIGVAWQTEYPSDGKYSEDTYKNRIKYFEYNQIVEAYQFIVNELVKKHYKVEFKGK